MNRAALSAGTQVMMMSDDKSGESDFLNRWSRKKAEARTTTVAEEEPVADAVGAEVDPEQRIAALDPEAHGGDDVDAVAESDEIPPEIADIDIDALDYNSDFTVFMKDNVPDVIRRRALRQLWRSNPVLANVDGLNDYDEDFTDAALVVKGLKSAYQIGKGYLTAEDEEGEDAVAAETADAESTPAEPAEAASPVDDTELADTEEHLTAEEGADAPDEGESETSFEVAVDTTLDDPVKEV